MSIPPLANWNGDEMPLDQVRVSVLDRGFLFGDAIYEVLRAYRGRAFLFEEHMDRLERNLRKIQLRSDAAELGRRAQRTLASSGIQEAVIYLQVTRGCAPRTHRFPDPPVPPNELVWVAEFHDHYAQQRQQGCRAILLDDLRWKRCDIKSVNLLANVLAGQQAHEAGCADAILMNEEGMLIEGSHTSLFGVRGGTILTAPLGNNILPGITRQLISRLASAAGIPLREQALHRDDLARVDELFLTGSTAEVLPLVRVDEASIGNGTPGPVTRRLQEGYRRFVESQSTA